MFSVEERGPQKSVAIQAVGHVLLQLRMEIFQNVVHVHALRFFPNVLVMGDNCLDVFVANEGTLQEFHVGLHAISVQG